MEDFQMSSARKDNYTSILYIIKIIVLSEDHKMFMYTEN